MSSIKIVIVDLVLLVVVVGKANNIPQKAYK